MYDIAADYMESCGTSWCTSTNESPSPGFGLQKRIASAAPDPVVLYSIFMIPSSTNRRYDAMMSAVMPNARVSTCAEPWSGPSVMLSRRHFDGFMIDVLSRSALSLYAVAAVPSPLYHSHCPDLGSPKS